MISEFYQLRRTAIKDIAAYLGFLIGFIGSAPFAWGLLAVQLDAGRFARGLWYFFGIVTMGGVFAGIAGMGLGVAAGRRPPPMKAINIRMLRLRVTSPCLRPRSSSL
jgi:hypothetical protein